MTLLAREQARTQRLRANAVAMDRAIKKLKKHVGKTWYVFSGSTPSGWDCSGLVRWTYQQVGIELEHSATKQANAGRIVEQPLPGDIVAYQYQEGKSYYHVGIYVGNGMTIQALRNKTRTMLVKADSPVVGFDKPVYIRILDRDGSTPASRAKAAATLPAN
jgi:cell wall-associated NlpC family hydrolase